MNSEKSSVASLAAIRVVLIAAAAFVSSAIAIHGQSDIPTPPRSPLSGGAEANVTVPPFIRFSGALADMNGKPLAGEVEVTFYLYEDREGGAPLWLETQIVDADSEGRYTVILGSNGGGLPSDIFAAGQARWLAVQAEGQRDEPRVLLMSVPYALKAGDAETVGGLPASAFLRAGMIGGTASPGAGLLAAVTNASPGGGGTADFVPLWTPDGSTLGNSILFQSGTGTTAKIGLNTTNPQAKLDVAGAAIVRGSLSLPATGAATSSKEFTSEPLLLQASAFSSSTQSAVFPRFQFTAEPTGNNTATPGASLNLLYGTPALTETGLSIASNGQITFAPGQTFPGGTISGSETIDGNLQAQFGSFTSSNTGDILLVQNQNATGGIGIASTAIGTNAIGMEGNASSTGGTGVLGQGGNNNGTGVQGNGNTGVAGTASTPAGFGVIGTGGSGTTAIGVEGISGGIGVSGVGNLNSGSGGIGVTGNGSKFGVSGTGATGVSGAGTVGVQGTGTDAGVFAEGSTTNESSQGVVGIGQHQGLSAFANASTGNHQAVFAQVNSSTGTGTLSIAVGESKTGTSLVGCCAIGVWGDTNQTTPGAAGLAGSADDAQAIFLGNNSVNHLTANINNFETTTHNVQMVNIQGAFGNCEFDTDGNATCSGEVIGKRGVFTVKNALIGGDLLVSGSKATVVPVDNGARNVALYAVEAPENWFEDYGGGTLVDGSAIVALEPVFLQTVNTGMEYRVFLTPKGDCEGLYVANETPQGFEVHELRGGRSNVEFDYRILARRKGYENLRLQDRTEEEARAKKQIEEHSARNAVPERKDDVMSQRMQRVARGAAADQP